MKLSKLTEPFQALRNTLFAKLYMAQTISLLGDVFTWVGLALLAYQFGEERAATILAAALTFRVTAFIIFPLLQACRRIGLAGKKYCMGPILLGWE